MSPPESSGSPGFDSGSPSRGGKEVQLPSRTSSLRWKAGTAAAAEDSSYQSDDSPLRRAASLRSERLAYDIEYASRLAATRLEQARQALTPPRGQGQGQASHAQAARQIKSSPHDQSLGQDDIPPQAHTPQTKVSHRAQLAPHSNPHREKQQHAVVDKASNETSKTAPGQYGHAPHPGWARLSRNDAEAAAEVLEQYRDHLEERYGPHPNNRHGHAESSTQAARINTSGALKGPDTAAKNVVSQRTESSPRPHFKSRDTQKKVGSNWINSESQKHGPNPMGIPSTFQETDSSRQALINPRSALERDKSKSEQYNLQKEVHQSSPGKVSPPPQVPLPVSPEKPNQASPVKSNLQRTESTRSRLQQRFPPPAAGNRRHMHQPSAASTIYPPVLDHSEYGPILAYLNRPVSSIPTDELTSAERQTLSPLQAQQVPEDPQLPQVPHAPSVPYSLGQVSENHAEGNEIILTSRFSTDSSTVDSGSDQGSASDGWTFANYDPCFHLLPPNAFVDLQFAYNPFRVDLESGSVASISSTLSNAYDSLQAQGQAAEEAQDTLPTHGSKSDIAHGHSVQASHNHDHTTSDRSIQADHSSAAQAPPRPSSYDNSLYSRRQSRPISGLEPFPPFVELTAEELEQYEGKAAAATAAAPDADADAIKSARPVSLPAHPLQMNPVRTPDIDHLPDSYRDESTRLAQEEPDKEESENLNVNPGSAVRNSRKGAKRMMRVKKRVTFNEDELREQNKPKKTGLFGGLKIWVNRQQMKTKTKKSWANLFSSKRARRSSAFKGF